MQVEEVMSEAMESAIRTGYLVFFGVLLGVAALAIGAWVMSSFMDD